MQLSEQQQAVVQHCLKGSGNLAVEAVAGSGKTSTVKSTIVKLGPAWRILYLVFNKKNQVEAAEKLPDYCEVKTFNAFGHGLCYKIGFKGRIDKDKVIKLFKFEVNDLKKADRKERKRIFKWAPKVSQLIGLFRGYALMNYPDAVRELDAITVKHDIELPDDQQFFDELKLTWDACLASKKRDFNDQLFLPVLHDADFGEYDFVFIDEAQDSNPIKIEFVKRIKATMKIVVGDRNQAIYGFAGADLDAFDTLKEVLDSIELPLTYCFRCAKAIVEEAKKIVPHIEAAPDAIEGSVTEGTHEDAEPGDFVICRTTAPLVAECLKFIRAGKSAVVLGRLIGDNLLKMAEDIGMVRVATLEQSIEKLESHRERSTAKLSKLGKTDQIQELGDRCDTLSVLLERCEVPSDLEDVIEEVFSEDQEGVVFMTAHKSKGLEADRVFILRPDLMPHPKVVGPLAPQEMNLKYVAVTRALKHLVFVKD